MTSRLTDDQLELAIVATKDRKWIASRIASALGVSTVAVTRGLRSVGIDPSDPEIKRHALEVELKQRLETLTRFRKAGLSPADVYDLGHSPKEIAIAWEMDRTEIVSKHIRGKTQMRSRKRFELT